MRLVSGVDFQFKEEDDPFILMLSCLEGEVPVEFIHLPCNILVKLQSGKFAVIWELAGIDIDGLLEAGLIDQARWERANYWATKREINQRYKETRDEQRQTQRKYIDRLRKLTEDIRLNAELCPDPREKSNLKRLLKSKEALLGRLSEDFFREFDEYP